MVAYIQLKLDPDAADEAAVLDGLRSYNTEAAGPGGHQAMALLLRDGTGRAIGGLTGRIGYGWLFVQLLHVPAELRGQGHGRALMQQAEAFAQARQLTGVWLDTFSFQARPFYEKLGYTVFGTLHDHPVGGARYFLSKRLDGAPG